ncbi:MAG: hypothetical protein ACK50E_03455 [Bacteroidota bacterium]
MLKALAAGRISKEAIRDVKQLDTYFLEDQTEQPYKFSIDGENVDEQEFRQRLDVSGIILGMEVVHVKLVNDEQVKPMYL